MSDSDPRVLRHGLAAPHAPADHDHGDAEQIVRHLEAHVGEVRTVWHELVSDKVHLDVHLVPPTPGRDVWTLFTTGMSERPMTVPEGAEEFAYAELMLCLPADWPMEEVLRRRGHPKSWPVGMLKELARLPHQYETWLGWGHSIPNGAPPVPYEAGTKLCAAVLLTPFTVPAEATRVVLEDGRTVHLWGVVGMTRRETELKLAQGVEALFDGFDGHRISEVWELGRADTA